MTLTRLRNNTYLGATSSGSSFQNNTPYDFYVFIDTDDGNKIKARNGRTGAIDPAGIHATNADVPLQYAMDQLSIGSVHGTSTSPVPGAGDLYNLWTGGKYGAIWVGPGLYNFYKYVILKSNISICGSGSWNTIFTMPDGLYNVGHNDNTIGIFKSSMWDAQAFSFTGAKTQQAWLGDMGITLRDFQIYGNWRNNVIPAVNTQTSHLDGSGYKTAGSSANGGDSWGHGIAIYGYGTVIDNVLVRSCPGAGIILQNGGGAIGSGYMYPVFGNQGSGMFDGVNYVTNCRSWGNGREGLLLRSTCYVSNYWSYFNGEAGIDAERCAYYGGGGWVEGIECFLDSVNHPDPVTGQQSTTYDPLGYEVRFAGWMSDAWIEAPFGCGDNLLIGSNGGHAPSPTGYQIMPTNGGFVGITNILLDYTRATGIMIGAGSSASIKNAFVLGVSTGALPLTRVNVSPMTVLGSFSDIELGWSGFNDDAGQTTTGVVIGNGSTSAVWNNLKLFPGYNNKYVIDNQNAGNVNRIEATVPSFGGNLVTFLKPGGAALSANNSINVNAITNNAGVIRSHNGGTATIAGNGGTTYTFPHLLFAAPTVISLTPKNTNAQNAPTYTVTADATNITITYSAVTSTSNQYWWDARVTP